MDIILNLLLLIITGFVIFKIKKIKKNIIFNLKYFILIIAYFYFLIPARIVKYINNIENWNFSEKSLFMSQVVTVYFIMMILSYCIFSKDYKIRILYNVRLKNITITVSKFITYFSIVYLSFILFKYHKFLYKNIHDLMFIREQYQILSLKYGIKSLYYLNLCTTTILYIRYKKMNYFLSIYLFIILDILQQSRTGILASILFITITKYLMEKNNKFNYVKFIILLIIIISYVSYFRMKYMGEILNNGSQILKSLYISLAEFTNTFITLVFLIDKQLGAFFPIKNFILNMLFTLIPGRIKILFLNEDILEINLGESIAKEIGRGFGLALNILTEFFGYFGYLGIIICPIILILYIIIVNKIIIKLRNILGIHLLILTLYYSRLFLREGLSSYCFILLFIICIYFWLDFIEIKNKFYILNNKKFLKNKKERYGKDINNINRSI